MTRPIYANRRQLRIWNGSLAAIFLAAMALVSAAPAHAALSFNLTPGQMMTGRYQYAIAVLPSGKVLIAGGIGGISAAAQVFDDAVLFDPQTGTFSPSAGKMSVARQDVPRRSCSTDAC